jgi:1-acyl-sn-glycerol-3-phosphate acyltransferase
MSGTHLWIPQSTCDAGCLPADRRRHLVRSVRRVAGTSAVLAGAVVLIPLLTVTPRRFLPRVQQVLARLVLRALGVRHEAGGRLPTRGALLVSNHVSWLDTLVILAHTPARLLAKREVGEWPVVGRLARALGTVFIDRTRPRTLPGTVAAVRDVLAGGGVVAVFPEGTTWCGREGGRFRPAMFQAAVDAGVPIVPLRLTFTVDGAPSTIAAFLGEDTLLASLCRVVAVRGLRVTLRAHPALHPTPVADRRTLATATHAVLTPSRLPSPVRSAPLAAPVPVAAPARHFPVAA